MTDLILIPRELFAFLCGDGPMQGHWFGENPEHEQGNFWWRKALRAADNAMVEAETIKGIIRAWLALDDPSAWGDFEKALDAAISDPPTLQRLGQEFDAGEVEPVAYRFVHLDYAGRKVSRYGSHPERVNGHDPIETYPLYAHPPQFRVATEPVRLREALEAIDQEAPANEPIDAPTVGFPPSRDQEDDDGNDIVADAFREGVCRGLWQAAEIARKALATKRGEV